MPRHGSCRILSLTMALDFFRNCGENFQLFCQPTVMLVMLSHVIDLGREIQGVGGGNRLPRQPPGSGDSRRFDHTRRDTRSAARGSAQVGRSSADRLRQQSIRRGRTRKIVNQHRDSPRSLRDLSQRRAADRSPQGFPHGNRALSSTSHAGRRHSVTFRSRALAMKRARSRSGKRFSTVCTTPCVKRVRLE